MISRVKGILNVAEIGQYPLFACLNLIAYSGLRRGEALGLRHQDLDLEVGTASIVRTISRSVERGIIVEPTKASAGRRVIDLDDITVNVLRAHIGRQLLYRMELGSTYQDHGLVFPGPLGEPLNRMKLTRAFQGLAKKQGIDGAKLHNLRHFHASVTPETSTVTCYLVGKKRRLTTSPKLCGTGSPNPCRQNVGKPLEWT